MDFRARTKRKVRTTNRNMRIVNKPDIVFIYPPLSVQERYARPTGKTGGHLPPLGIASLASYIRDKGFSVDILDALALNLDDAGIVGWVRKNKPKVVAFSSLTSMFHRAVICAKTIKKHFPNTIILVGGHHASIMPKQVMENYDCFDLLVYGEGERTIHDLMLQLRKAAYDKSFLKNHAKLKSVPGICFRANKSVVLSEPRALIEDLDELPFPARDLLPMDKYAPLPNQYKRTPVVHMVAIRGCPYSCTFCSNNAVFGKKIRAKSPARIVQEIQHLKKEYGAKEISFWDDTMTANPAWMTQLCNLLIKEKVGITWTGYSRANTVTEELLNKMARAGCWNLFYGFEAGDQRLLDNINKGQTLQDIRNANKWSKEAGIEVRASFMLALPGETPQLAQKTINFAKELNAEYAQFSITCPFPGTKLHEEAKQHGTLSTDFSKYNCWEPVFIPHGYKNKKEILKMEKKAVRQYYARPAFLWMHLKHLKTWEDVKRYAKGARFLLGFV